MGRNLMFPPHTVTILVPECCSARLTHNSDESSPRSKASSAPRAPDHKQVSSHFPSLHPPLSLSLSFCQCWRQDAVSVASPPSLEDLERWRLIDELGESSNVAQPSVSEPPLCQTAEQPACLPALPSLPARRVQALANLVNAEWLMWWHGGEYKCAVTRGQYNLEPSHPAHIHCRGSPKSETVAANLRFTDWNTLRLITVLVGRFCRFVFHADPKKHKEITIGGMIESALTRDWQFDFIVHIFIYSWWSTPSPKSGRAAKAHKLLEQTWVLITPRSFRMVKEKHPDNIL